MINWTELLQNDIETNDDIFDLFSKTNKIINSLDKQNKLNYSETLIFLKICLVIRLSLDKKFEATQGISKI